MTPARAAAAACLVALAAASCAGSLPDDPVATPAVTPGSDSVRAGALLDVSYRFEVEDRLPPGDDEYVVFLHAVDDRGTLRWTDDHAPVVPTSRWKRGDVVEYVRPMMVPRRMPAGVVHLEVGLYLPRTGGRLPLGAPGGVRRSYRMASVRVLEPVDLNDGIFTEGWYDVEHAGDAAGTTWRWSDREGHIWFRNPRRDATLVLRLDGSIAGVTRPRQVELRVGETVVDRVDLVFGAAVLRTVPLSGAVLGDEDIVRLRVIVDAAVTPASLPEAGNPDARSLGVRVFEAYLQPISGARARGRR